jgi:hypothetical protein
MVELLGLLQIQIKNAIFSKGAKTCTPYRSLGEEVQTGIQKSLAFLIPVNPCPRLNISYIPEVKPPRKPLRL